MSDKKYITKVVDNEKIIKPLDFAYIQYKEFLEKYINEKLSSYCINKKIKNFETLNCFEKTEITKELIQAINSELEEIKDWLPWKHWKKYNNFKFEQEEIKYEIIDLLHFVFQLALLWGIEAPDELGGYFYKKLKENIRRQENGY